jgi:predicted DNA-binding transcriptional regulator AlpA
MSSAATEKPPRKRQKQPPAPLPPGVYDRRACMSRIGLRKSAFYELRRSGRFPQPDVAIGTYPRWKASTIEAWIENGGATGPTAKAPFNARPTAKSGSPSG